MEKEDFDDVILDHSLQWDVNSSMIDFVGVLLPSDEMSLDSSQITSLHSNTIISSIRVGSEDQKIEKTKRGRKRRNDTQQQQQQQQQRLITKKQLQRLEHRKRCRLTFNRIVKDDLRRQLPIMCCNVMNTCNITLTRSFFRRYSRSDCEFIGPGCKPISISSSHLKGPDELASHLDTISTQVPDIVLFLLGSRIIRNFYEESSVVEMFVNVKASRSTYPIVSSVGDQVSIGPKLDEVVVDVEAKFKISIFMNREGVMVKIVATAMTSFPAFLPTPSTKS